jgi:serine protease Do
MNRRAALSSLALLALLPPALAGCQEGVGSSPPPYSAQAPAPVDESTLPELAPAPPREEQLAEVQREVDGSRRTAIVQASERVAPAVVSINTRRVESVQPRSLWESFFIPPGERESSGLGSGFVIRADGLILTNEHVVRGADEVVVTLADGREFDAEIVGTDEVNDLALIRIRAAGREKLQLPVAPFGNSDDLMIGEWVVAIGNPFGYLLSNYEPTVTAGVVSAVGRNMLPGDERGYYLDMIQTDASINPGNSGGPLINALGEVIGVNSSIISRSGGSEGLGFAIPINRARRIALDLLNEGRVRRAWVGLELEPTGGGRGGSRAQVRIAGVAPGSPAAQGGLRPGMLLVAAGSKRIRSPLDWEAALLNASVGQPLEIRVEDGGKERLARLTPADPPSVTAERFRALSDFELVTLTASIRAERGLTSEKGALIVSLSEIAREIGLREGDLILQINRTPIESAAEAARLLQRMAGRGPVRVVFERQGRVGSVHFYVNG